MKKIATGTEVRRALRAAALLMLTVAGLAGCGDGDQRPELVSFGVAGTPHGERLSYNRDVRPILSDACFACHGPDASGRQADLRLDREEDAPGVWGGRSVLAGGAASELAARVRSVNPKRMMPPPEAKRALSDEERAILVQWSAEGGVYEPHWAFVPPAEDCPPPDVSGDAWAADDLDRFVLARLKSEGLEPSAAASRERWLRRVSFDLTGMPPTLEEIDAFTSDGSANAFERVVDRLLASPRYGEQMAVAWLDLARYADTYGYSVDGLRASWPWRDWLIGAFNDNMPYDEMVTMMLAGDLASGSTREQKLATAFNRLHRMNAEGGAIREEWRQEYVADRVHTFGTVFLGLTLECARCHDHRYDPITQRAYYELSAFFNSIDESGTTEYQRPDIVPPPTMLLPDDAQATELHRLAEEAAMAERAVRVSEEAAERAFAAWLEAPGPIGVADLVGSYPLDAVGAEGVLANRVPDGPAGRALAHESVRVPWAEGGGIRVDGDNLLHFPGVADLDRWTPFTVALGFRVDAIDDGPARVVAHRSSGTDVGPFGFDLVLEGGRLSARCYRSWPGNAIGVRTGDVVRAGEWVRVVWRYDGSSRAEGMDLWVDGEEMDLEVVRDGTMVKSVGGGHAYGPGGHDLVLGQRFRDRGLGGATFSDVQIVRRAVSALEAQELSAPGAIGRAIEAADMDAMRGYYLSAVDPDVRAARAELAAARRRLVEFEDGLLEIAVMEETAPRETHVLSRGLYDAPTDESTRVSRDVPGGVMPWPQGAPRDRAGLAAWLTDDSHPLTARVAVNRLWAQCFGRGLVTTPDDFGMQGAWPTHPELLDHLARSFVRSGWDTKAMLKRMVLSATYRQDSAAAADRWRLDPENALLGRGPARRLSAEMIRDAALSASGLLVERLGGPPVYPYQPSGLWEEVNGARYETGTGEQLYRRSLYTVWKRAVPPPSMMAFDAPSREACTASRSETNTPLQALVLLNDVQFVESARVLAARVMSAVDGEEAQIGIGFRLLTARDATPSELARLGALLEEQRALYSSQPALAAALIAQGEHPVEGSADAVELAAMTAVMHTIMNLDAAVWLR